ncbi:MAG TPA: PEP-CTERM sorting domain-containing protein [Pyrinomonadaceae bacterium]|jgi:hypothetical protein
MFRFNKTLTACAIFILLGCAAASNANAAPVVHVTRAAFDAAAPNTNTITFGTTTIDYANSITNFPPVTFAGAANHQVGVHTGSNFGLASGNYALVSNSNTPGQFNVDNIVITLPGGTHAVGFDLKCGNATQVPGVCAGEYAIYVNGALATTVSSNQFNSFSFIGFTAAEEISTIAIRALSGGQPIVDNFSTDAAATVPEPTTMVLFGTGLAGVASFARKRRRGNGLDDGASDEAEESARS